MRLIKKIGAGCLAVFIIFTAYITIMGMPSEAPFTELKAVENITGLLVESYKNVNDGKADRTGSEEDYKYTINQDGTAKILKYLKEEKEVTAPSKLEGHPVTVIGENAFKCKRSTTSIHIPNTVTDIESEAFSCAGIKEAVIPESVLRIGRNAFWYCPELAWIYISKNVEKIEGNIVQESDKLTKIDVDPRNTAYTSVDGILYNKDMTELLAVPGGRDLIGFKFMDSVVSIGEDAFCGNVSGSFTELIISDQITNLGDGVFQSCRNLERVVIGKGVTVMGNQIFMGCENLTEVVVKGKPKMIGKEVFTDCYSLTRVNIPDGVTEIGDFAFYNCGLLQNVTVPKSVIKIGHKAIGYSEDCDELISGVYIIGYKDTEAYDYAKRASVAFRDIETDEAMRFDLVSVPIPREKIEILATGKKKIELECSAVEDVSYQVAVKKDDASSWKKYYASEQWVSIEGLESGKQYKVKVRAWREIDGNRYYGEWSKVKKITVG